jgi:hypothetical protein
LVRENLVLDPVSVTTAAALLTAIELAAEYLLEAQSYTAPICEALTFAAKTWKKRIFVAPICEARTSLAPTSQTRG